jgi:DNA repair protein RadC
VYPRVVAERALRYGAAAVLVAHNHPSGIVDPSRADQAITLRLINALGLLDVRLLDHFVVGSEGAVSIVAQPESRPARAAKKPTRKPRGRKSAS